jgi:hypothetical protein
MFLPVIGAEWARPTHQNAPSIGSKIQNFRHQEHV